MLRFVFNTFSPILFYINDRNMWVPALPFGFLIDSKLEAAFHI